MLRYTLHYVNGLYFQLDYDEEKNREYDVKVIDRQDKNTIYQTKLKVGGWLRTSKKYLADLAVVISYEGRTIKQINFLDEIKGKRVFISFESKALGDTLAWMPYCLEFAKHYECKVIVSTFKNFLFEKSYPELEFVGRGIKVDNLVGMFELGWYWDELREPKNPILDPLQKSACNILHLPYKEIVPILDFIPTKESPIDGKYVCISTISTSGCKLWDYWQDLIDFLVSKGYKVLEISNDETKFENLTPFTDKSIENTMNTIHHSDFFVGLSSGLSWLSWSLRKKVYMISNFSLKDHEFSSNTIRIYDESTCHGCWNNPKFRFNKGDWNWCPEHENTPRKFECHRLITSDRVIKIISENEGI